MTPDLTPLFPPGVSLAAGRITEVEGRVWPEEAACVTRSVEKRRAEFHAGRVLARGALAAVGARDAALLPGPDRAPVWPAGFTGSITHTDSWVAVAVARRPDYRALGVDIEEIGRFHPRLETRILSPAEIAEHLDGLDPAARQAMSAALFCVKEAFYKCQFPLTGRRLGFHDVAVETLSTERDGGVVRVAARPTSDPAGAMTGRYALLGELAAAAFSAASRVG